jgi:AcrR family transcriptional regulator
LRIVKNPVERKKELIMAANEFFMSNGYEKTTIEDIINKVGVAKGCFYHYFRSKKEIFEACIDSLSDSILKSYLNIFTDDNKKAKQKLLEYIDYNFKLVEKEHSTNIIESIHSDTFERIHERIIQDSIKQIMPNFIQLLEKGKEEGDFNIISAEFTATALLGAFEQIHLQSSQNYKLDVKKQHELIMDFMERLLQTKF